MIDGLARFDAKPFCRRHLFFSPPRRCVMAFCYTNLAVLFPGFFFPFITQKNQGDIYYPRAEMCPFFRCGCLMIMRAADARWNGWFKCFWGFFFPGGCQMFVLFLLIFFCWGKSWVQCVAVIQNKGGLQKRTCKIWWDFFSLSVALCMFGKFSNSSRHHNWVSAIF